MTALSRTETSTYADPANCAADGALVPGHAGTELLPHRLPARARVLLAGRQPVRTQAQPSGRRLAVSTTAAAVSRSGLLRRLDGPARVTVVSAPPGSGKTVLLRSWIGEAALADRAAWVAGIRDERDPRQFWLCVAGALRQTVPGSALVRALPTAPELDGWAITERLLTDLASLTDRIWLVVDDAHELHPETLRQLELLIMRAPPGLRFVLASRHDVRLGLHRLRLEGDLAEIRGADLRFSLAETAEMLAASGVELPGPTVTLLHQRTEGWAAGLRLAALGLAGHPDPGRFAAGFCGSERTVAEYLMAEVLDRQGEAVRRLLLRTSILERVNGELADLLTGDDGGDRVLQDLDLANAFVVSLDEERSWFRYHQMFAELLQLELRRTAPGEVAGLHAAASSWFAGHACPVQAVRHAQAARQWRIAAGLLADHWPGLYLDGRAAAAGELLAGFPAGASAENPELAALAAADELAQGSLEAAEQYLGRAERRSSGVPAARRGQFRVLLEVVRLLRARQRGNPRAVAEYAERLQAAAEAPEAAQPCLGEDLRALAMVSLGIAGAWTTGFAEAKRHLEQGVTGARRAGRPYLEFSGLSYQASIEVDRSFARAADRSRQTIELAERHGWADEPAMGNACGVLAGVLVWQGRPGEAEPWLERAERAVTAEAEPAARLAICYIRGWLELVLSRDASALAAFRAAERLGGRLAAPNRLVSRAGVMQVYLLARLGDTRRAGQVLASLRDHDRDRAETRIATALLRLAQGDPRAAAVALAPLLDGSASDPARDWLAHAFLLEAISRDKLGDEDSAGRSLERALDLAEPDGMLSLFLLYPAPGLLRRHAGHRTAHAGLITEVQSLLAGLEHPLPSAGPRLPLEPLSDSELRVLRYLPTNLTAPEISRELNVSRHTVKTHMRHLYAKLGTHRRAETVARARDLGLLASLAGRAMAPDSGLGARQFRGCVAGASN